MIGSCPRPKSRKVVRQFQGLVGHNHMNNHRGFAPNYSDHTSWLADLTKKGKSDLVLKPLRVPSVPLLVSPVCVADQRAGGHSAQVVEEEKFHLLLNIKQKLAV